MDTLVSRENKGEKTHLFLSTEGNVAKNCSFCSLMWCVASLCWEQEVMRAECIGLNGTRAVMWGCRGNCLECEKKGDTSFSVFCAWNWYLCGASRARRSLGSVTSSVSFIAAYGFLYVGCGSLIGEPGKPHPWCAVGCGVCLTPLGWPACSRLRSTGSARRCNRLSPGKELQEQCFHLQDSLLCATSAFNFRKFRIIAREGIR